MTTIMVKKILAGGEPCKKCVQAEDMLRKRGLWDRIDQLVIAREDEPESEGMRLARKFGVEAAPFFIQQPPEGEAVVFTSALRFAKALTEGGAPPDVAQVPTDAALELLSPPEIVRAALARFGAACAISFSGAEDVVLIDMASRSGLPFSVFTLDTGRLHQETHEFIDRVRKHYGVEIIVVSPEAAGVEALVRAKGLFSFYEDGHRECCGIRKVAPLRRLLATFDAQLTGLRKDQSPTRTDVPVTQEDTVFEGASGMLVKYNPLANWTGAQVWDYIRENEVPFNALHEQGYISIGCAPCTRPPRPGEHERAGRWWWEAETKRECGLHVK